MKALITGASSGIGYEMALYLSELGYDLILVARREDKLKELKSKINTNVKIICSDLASLDNVIKLYNKVKKEDIDILINNAGFGLLGEFVDTDFKKELEMINLNIVSLHYLTKMFLKDMVNKDYGYILNVSSSAAFLAGPKMSTYYATKNYVSRLSEAIYEELRRNKSNVSISTLNPGPVNTEFNKVAGVKFNIKGASCRYVARYGIDNMFKKKLIIVPTLKVKLGLLLHGLVPRKILMKLVYNFQNNKY